MKRIILTFFVSALLLSSCSQQQAEGEHSDMLGLQLLLTQSANLAVLPGEVARKHALELARRAMSGPEMNAMHHAGDHQPMMKSTHDLGDAVFEVLEAATLAQAGQHEALKLQIQVAAQAAQMRLSGQLLGSETGLFMQAKGGSFIATPPSHRADKSVYDSAAIHLLGLLYKTGLNQTKYSPEH